MYNLNVDFVAECIKTLSVNAQCATCDKLIGPFVRFPCGHSVCETCAERTGECLFCVSSPNGSYVVDNHETARVNNTLTLLTAFQESFKIDVDKRQRISDHLKLEKEVFPQCIQAPNKYINKRKSLNDSIRKTNKRNKENINPITFLGDQLANAETIKMKKIQYVQNWLDKQDDVPQYVQRRPFRVINVNTQSEKKKTIRPGSVNNQINANKSTHRKRNLRDSSLLIKINSTEKQGAKSKILEKHTESHLKHKCDRNESGIEIDHEPILIEDEHTIARPGIPQISTRDDYNNDIIPETGLQYNATNIGNIANSEIDVENVSKSILRINKTTKQVVKSEHLKKYTKNHLKYNSDKNESGIEDEPILVEDTEMGVIDKDEQAWQAVLEIARRDECNNKHISSETGFQYDAIDTNVMNNNEANVDVSKSREPAKAPKNVLFYRKGSLFKSCNHCNHHIKNKPHSDTKENKNKDVSIVVSNSSIITTIKFTQCVGNNGAMKKTSVPIQTDISGNSLINNVDSTNLLKRKTSLNEEIVPTKITKSNVAVQSLDIFPTNKTTECTKPESISCDIKPQATVNHSRNSNHVIVEESDTDSNTSNDNIHEVVAEIHRAPETVETRRRILSTLPKSNYQNRVKQPLRGHTPNSTDSSDKENFDPNRKRTTKSKKKQKNKKI